MTKSKIVFIESDRYSAHRRLVVFFFFSSRRRHTRLQGDWSSDVCSSDLRTFRNFEKARAGLPTGGLMTLRIFMEIGRATSELQSPCNLVCRLLLEKKKRKSLCQRSVYVYTSDHVRTLVCTRRVLITHTHY